MLVASTSNITLHFDPKPKIYFTKIHLKAYDDQNVKLSIKISNDYTKFFQELFQDNPTNAFSTRDPVLIHACLSFADRQLTGEILSFMKTYMRGIVYPVAALKQRNNASPLFKRMHILDSEGRCSTVKKGHRIYLELAQNKIFEEICIKVNSEKKHYLRIKICAEIFSNAEKTLPSIIKNIIPECNSEGQFLTSDSFGVHVLIELALNQHIITCRQENYVRKLIP